MNRRRRPPAQAEGQTMEDLLAGPPRREAAVLLYSIVALTFVHLHGKPHFLPEELRLFGWFFTNFVVLFCAPALFIRYVWRLRLDHFGLQWGDVGTWGRYFAVYFLVMLPIVLWISRTPQFQAYYPMCQQARESTGWLIASLLGWLVYFFAWEWFFRGFMLFSLAPRYGGGIAILVQLIPFVMMHYPKPDAEAWSSIIAGVALGLMAFRGRSFLGCWLLHWAVAALMDLSVVLFPLR